MLTLSHHQGKVIEMGLDWLKSDEAVHKLERMIWGLEVLRTFDDSLSSSLSEIKEARDRMLHVIEQVREVKLPRLSSKMS